MNFLKLLMVAVTLFCLLILSASAEQGATVVSPALTVLAEKSYMAKATVAEDEIIFLAEDFEKALNVSFVSSVTITSLPERADGILYLGGSEVALGQVVSRAEIPYMKFVFMSEDIRDSAFEFSADTGNYSMACALYRLEYENYAPEVATVDRTVLAVSTYSNISVYGKMDAYDPDGDALFYEVIQYPENGLLLLTDGNGEYKYVPLSRFSGEDHFSYVAVDRYGNYSDVVSVSLTVTPSSISQVYQDLFESEIHVAAIAMTERGVMASTELGDTYYFYPESEVSRAEFVAMIMKTMGIYATESDVKTVFSDDNDIPAEYKGYVNLAQRLGYVCGKLNGEGNLYFDPNAGITRAEAAVIVYNMVELALPVIRPSYADMNSAPVWARDAVYALSYAGLLDRNGGYIEANSVLTRGTVAQMLYRLSQMDL